ncbi:D-serine ammonia-lyase [Paenirhodobacter sp.]|uniref:D-serine ammonia-lyase n=1 Tax=Paenirhodobacter sp. TaxID=1965326 RepID=UPI003B422C55
MTIEAEIQAGRPVLWRNPGFRAGDDPQAAADLAQALAEWREIAPVLAGLFPDLPGGVIASDLVELDPAAFGVPGRVFVKADNALPVAGSVKARGGVFEVVTAMLAEARAAGVVGDDPRDLLRASAFLAGRTIAVGSTGNLGLSVGIAARALGCRAVVHMSSDAKPWKVARLRDRGVEVVQHRTDYTSAVAAARAAAAADPACYFVDDEDSIRLFRGYSAAARELAGQLAAAGVHPTPEAPVVLHLPCGIGGAPGGIAQGARGVWGAAVHPFFVEPVQAPSALVQMMRGPGVPVSVYDYGLTNRTEADGMAVATMSALVAERMRHRLAGVYTVTDGDLFRWLAFAAGQGLRLEPSAAAGFAGPGRVGLGATHVIWATGGAFVPEDQYQDFLDRGRRETEDDRN